MSPEPNPALADLYRQRIEHRNAPLDQTKMASARKEAMLIEIAIHEAERKHGRGVYTFRRCATCALMHSASTQRCDGKGEPLFAVWLRLSVDLVAIVE